MPYAATGVGAGIYNAAGSHIAFFAETGFYNPLFPATYANVGLADSGTRLMARFDNVPSGVALYVGLYEVDTAVLGTPMRSAETSRLRLITTDSSGGGPFSPAAGTSNAESTGQSTTFASLAPVVISNGSGYAVWEVMRAWPGVETFLIPFAIAYDSSNGYPRLGTTGVRLSLAPLGQETAFSATAPIPRFADVAASSPLFTVLPCFSVRPGPLGFTYKIGSAVPGPVSIPISSGALPVAFTASPSASWLLVRPPSDTTPTFLKVSVNPIGLGVGTYQGSLNASANGSAGRSATSIAVTLRVRAAVQ